MQDNEAKSAVVLHIDRGRPNSQNHGILAVYIKSFKEATTLGDPIRATVQASIVEEDSSHSGAITMSQEQGHETDLAMLIQAVLTVDERESTASAGSLASSGGDI